MKLPDQDKREIVTLIGALGILLAIWFMVAWVIANASLESEVQEVIKTQSQVLDELTGKTAQSIDQGLDYLHEIPVLVAKDERVLNFLSRNVLAVSSLAARNHGGTGARADSQLRLINAYLIEITHALKADIVWILNSSGDCIASSNVQTPDSFVGTNYVDRDYFRLGQEGKRGQQYAIGRKTNVPGLYFSAPINRDGKFLGVAVVKIDIPKLAHMVSQADSFITDRNGVVIMARDPTLEMHSLPNAAINAMSAPERLRAYKRTDFPLLKIVPWNGPAFPLLHSFGTEQQPAIISSVDLRHESLGVHAFKRIPAAADFFREKIQRFWLISISGTIVFIIVGGLLLFALLRKHSAYSAAHSASLLRAAIESTADGVLVVDNNNIVRTYNQHFAAIGHLSEPPPAGTRSGDILIPLLDQMEERQLFLDNIAELERHPQNESFDSFRLKDGTQIECYSLPHWLKGRIVGRVWSFRDVTIQRQAEQELQASRDNLEQLVQDRTQELQRANANLLAQKARQDDLIKQLAEAHQFLLQSEKLASIGQLAAGVAHEINNPIGFVKSNLKTLQQYVADLLSIVSAYEQVDSEILPAIRDSIDALKQTVDLVFMRDDIENLFGESIDGLGHVAQIVRDLKVFSHMGKYEWSWANLEHGLESTLRVVWNELKYKVTLVKEYGEIPDVQCIPSQINQVFMNILINAAHAIEEQGQITVRTGCENEMVYIDICDTGSGISSECLTRIFDPFFTTKPIGKGTGLGLSISYGIVQRHQGRIEVKSEVGVGTDFRIWLPLARIEQ